MRQKTWMQVYQEILQDLLYWILVLVGGNGFLMAYFQVKKDDTR